ncbi:MAG: MCE family protein [Solirubrobacteraceae bacterium]|nr:MCE family protein [Solirubrobacteraceae bacterium]
MNKQRPRRLQIAAMVAFALSCVCLLLFLWTSFGGPVPLRAAKYHVYAEFRQGSQLASYADVRISGVSVGKVRRIERAGGRARVRIDIEPRFVPLPRSTRAALRTKTLVGETFVVLSFGDRRGPTLPEGGTIPRRQTVETVEIDRILDAFDRQTRAAFQRLTRSFATATRGRGRDLSDAIGHAEPTVAASRTLLGALDRRSAAVRSGTRDAATAFRAAGEDEGALRELVRAGRTVLAVTADEERALSATLDVLPRFLDETRSTAAVARRAAGDVEPAVRALRPAAAHLTPALRGLERLAPELRRLFVDAGPLLRASRTGLPAVAELLEALPPAAEQVGPALADAVPILRYLWRYRRDVITTFTAGAAAGASRSPGTGGELFNMARVTTVLNSDILGGAARRMPANRATAYPLPENMRDVPRGLAAWSCSHADGPGGPLSVLDLTGVQPCREQGPLTFDGRTSMFPRLRPAVP